MAARKRAPKKLKPPPKMNMKFDTVPQDNTSPVARAVLSLVKPDSDITQTDDHRYAKWLMDNSVVPANQVSDLGLGAKNILDMTVNEYKTHIRKAKKKALDKTTRSKLSRKQVAKACRPVNVCKTHIPIEYGRKQERDYVVTQAAKFWRDAKDRTQHPYSIRDYKLLLAQQADETLTTHSNKRSDRLLRINHTFSGPGFFTIKTRLKEYKQSKQVDQQDTSLHDGHVATYYDIVPWDTDEYAETVVPDPYVHEEQKQSRYPTPTNRGEAVASVGLLNDQIKHLRSDVSELMGAVNALLGVVKPMNELSDTVSVLVKATTAQANALTTQATSLTRIESKLDVIADDVESTVEISSDTLATVSTPISILHSDANSHMQAIKKETPKVSRFSVCNECLEDYDLPARQEKLYSDNEGMIPSGSDHFCSDVCYELDKSIVPSSTIKQDTLTCKHCDEAYKVSFDAEGSEYCTAKCRAEATGSCNTSCSSPVCTNCSPREVRAKVYRETNRVSYPRLLQSREWKQYAVEESRIQYRAPAELCITTPVKVAVYIAPNERTVSKLIESGRLNHLMADYSWDKPFAKYTWGDTLDRRRYARWFKQRTSMSLFDEMITKDMATAHHVARKKHEHRYGTELSTVGIKPKVMYGLGQLYNNAQLRGYNQWLKTHANTEEQSPDSTESLHKPVHHSAHVHSDGQSSVVKRQIELLRLHKVWTREEHEEYRRYQNSLKYHTKDMLSRYMRKVWVSHFKHRQHQEKVQLAAKYLRDQEVLTSEPKCTDKHETPKEEAAILLPSLQLEAPMINKGISTPDVIYLPDHYRVEPSIVSRDASAIKEILSEEDYEVVIQGVLCDSNVEDSHPLSLDLKRALHELHTLAPNRVRRRSGLIEEIKRYCNRMTNKVEKVYSLPYSSNDEPKVIEGTVDISVLRSKFNTKPRKQKQGKGVVSSMIHKISESTRSFVQTYTMTDIDKELAEMERKLMNMG